MFICEFSQFSYLNISHFQTSNDLLFTSSKTDLKYWAHTKVKIDQISLVHDLTQRPQSACLVAGHLQRANMWPEIFEWQFHSPKCVSSPNLWESNSLDIPRLDTQPHPY